MDVRLPAPPKKLLPLLRFLRPAPEELAAFAARNAKQGFTYAEIGATKGDPPKGWFALRDKVELGQGSATYVRAVEALDAWRMFDASWLTLHTEGPPTPERTVAFASKQLGTWAMNACRVVYREEDEDAEQQVTAFAYGTLPDHVFRGEERFEVRWDRATDTVWFEIRQFSIPSNFLTRLLQPFARGVQRRFVQDAFAHMVDAVAA